MITALHQPSLGAGKEMSLRSLFSMFVLLSLSSCSYLEYAALQAEYRHTQTVEPGQANLKHMLELPSFSIIGKTTDTKKKYGNVDIAIAAYSDKFTLNERVDTMALASAGTHFGLSVPEGEYSLVATADINRNGQYEKDEVVALYHVELSEASLPGKVLEGVELELTEPIRLDWVETFDVPQRRELQTSLFYPAGSIRSLDDPIFNQNVATLGMYDPASFMEICPTMFFALEEDLGHKIPLVFVHGVDGSPRAFQAFIDQLDRERYKALFFYYPSGADLDLHADMFYRIFLSGTILRTGPAPMIIVAHSMGGLVVREALNRFSAKKGENNVRLFFTLATPFGGHPAAVLGEKYGPMVLPSWRDVNPEGKFIKKLYRRPLAEGVDHILVYAYRNPSSIKLNENSDGVVPLSSQLYPKAQSNSTEQFGFNASHTSILTDEGVIDYVYEKASLVKGIYPADHYYYLVKGGVADFPGIEAFSPLLRHIVKHYLWYMLAISDGLLQPFQAEEEDTHFYLVAQGKAEPKTDLEQEWVDFLKYYRSLEKK